ncbi:MAG: aryldialkylphosphatase [Hyphomicrobiales bacterium]|nr:aryldialkylphosphatase [Hyphomicrobiales bacterium]MCP4998750.1 aryldialkylphosphatase [Hyphomicrobiales bacterium]
MNQFAQSVTGTLTSGQLGKTLMHEHILCDLRDPSTRDADTDCPPITMENRFQTNYFQNRNPCNMVLDEVTVAERELALFCSAGGGAIVELSVGGLRPQPQNLRSLSHRTGANIIMGAGYYVDAYMPQEIRSADIETLESLLQTQLNDGAWSTDIRAGIIGEIGCSWPLEESEQRMLTAAARVQAKTGVAITVHPGRHCDAPAQIAKILLAAGADPKRTVLGHMDRTIFDQDRLVTLLQKGFVLEWDFFGIETSQYWMAGCDLDLPTDYTRLDLIYGLINMGFRGQITVSHDICTKTRLSAYGGHGYRHLLINIVPMMQRRGWTNAEIEELFVETPARLLCYLTDETSTCRIQ